LRDEFLFEIFAAFCVPVVWGWPVNGRVVVGVVGEIEVGHDWFGHFDLCCFVLRLVGVRGGGPPVSSLFRLCGFSCIACRLCNR